MFKGRIKGLEIDKNLKSQGNFGCARTRHLGLSGLSQRRF
jgi:hypothetical protein